MKSNKWVRLAATSALLAVGCSRALAPEGHYQATPVAIDGDISDWGLPLRFSNPEYSMQYAVINDDKNIYVCVYSKDQSMQWRVLKAGMAIYFDTKGEKDKKMGLVFPIKKPDDQAARPYGEPIRNSDYRNQENQYLLQSDYYNTEGLVNFENGQYGIADAKTNIRVAIKIHADSSLVYELAVPLSYIRGTDMKPAYSSDNISVGIVVNANTNPNRNSSFPHSSYEGGGMRGMGMHGGGNRNYGSSNNTAPKAEENWYRFRLVYKKPETK